MNWKSLIPFNHSKPGALSSGLCIFLTLLYILNWVFPINNGILLSTASLKKIQLNRLTLYPLAHLSLAHLVFNCMSLFPQLTIFEAVHGTFYTAIVLNMLALFTAVFYCLLGMLFFPNSQVGGASGWCFSLLGYYSAKESELRPYYQVTANHKIPTILFPLILVVLLSLLLPQSSFWGHIIGLCLGYLMAIKEPWLQYITPPSWAITKIETWMDKWISLIPSFVVYYRENNASRNHGYISIYQDDQLPLYNDNFQGQGRVVGP
ncbi:putative rhomboid protease RBD2 Ecym_2141 [Eremothecium cymbalariae DBVPG|uniref:Rhomboid-type serine protease 2 n=1 Tax=Eremothecium cymbalariae (strain CBS 270.75 / DBVPG 7215 / KCTC 17166 / NRRL Y-17582) TaxID=931890 RepID=G8JNH7_ERECY|nr:Hypothetical protein Ecym_2141 [Eremothecium cymbalariae DBVPG\